MRTAAAPARDTCTVEAVRRASARSVRLTGSARTCSEATQVAMGVHASTPSACTRSARSKSPLSASVWTTASASASTSSAAPIRRAAAMSAESRTWADSSRWRGIASARSPVPYADMVAQ
ncbi:MAG: hypothetical protein ACKOFI_02955, partial [Phycisphaerales bacterium]